MIPNEPDDDYTGGHFSDDKLHGKITMIIDDLRVAQTSKRHVV